jgi:hypothetical protein
MQIDPFVNTLEHIEKTRQYNDPANHAVTIEGHGGGSQAPGTEFTPNVGGSFDLLIPFTSSLDIGINSQYDYMWWPIEYYYDGTLTTSIYSHHELSVDPWAKLDLGLLDFGLYTGINSAWEMYEGGNITGYNLSSSNFDIGLFTSFYDTVFATASFYNLGNSYTLRSETTEFNYANFIWGLGLNFDFIQAGYLQQILLPDSDLYGEFTEDALSAEHTIYVAGDFKLGNDKYKHLLDFGVSYMFNQDRFKLDAQYTPPWLENMFYFKLEGSFDNFITPQTIDNKGISITASIGINLFSFGEDREPMIRSERDDSSSLERIPERSRPETEDEPDRIPEDEESEDIPIREDDEGDVAVPLR